eukprot:13361121-Alexandrium_andersonii.AAC.1
MSSVVVVLVALRWAAVKIGNVDDSTARLSTVDAVPAMSLQRTAMLRAPICPMERPTGHTRREFTQKR